MQTLNMTVLFEHREVFLWCLPVLVLVPLTSLWAHRNNWQIQRAYMRSAAQLYGRRKALVGLITKLAFVDLIVLCFAWALSGPYTQNALVTVPEGAVNLVMGVDVTPSFFAEPYRSIWPTEDGTPPQADEPWGSCMQIAKETFAHD